jgi:hypothetical protein
MARPSPIWNRRRSAPASNRAAADSGGVLISLCSQTRGLYLVISRQTDAHVTSDMYATGPFCASQ